MAVLVGGQTWGLSSSKGKAKTVFLVKLTDAALRTLEEYLGQQSAASLSAPTPSGGSEAARRDRGPSIRFPAGQQDLGTISIPAGSDGKQAEFSFSLSSLEDSNNGLKGGFECLSADSHGSLESIGTLQEKLQVQAADDTYKAFGEKMFEAKKESEKRTTQFLDRGPNSSLSKSRYARKKFPNIKAKDSSAIRSSSGGKSPNFLPGNHPMLDRSAAPASYSKSHMNLDLMKRPLKERIIHLLAVRPFKKPELILRINRDGIHEKDKKNISSILKQVSVMKDNTYNLVRHMWNDVSEDWPFYNEQDRQSFRRRKPQNLTPPCSDGSTSSCGHSPASSSHHHHPAASPPSASAKRYYAGSGGDEAAVSAKKRRVSNYVRPPDMRMGGEVSPFKTSPMLRRTPPPSVRSPGRSPGQSPPAAGRSPPRTVAATSGSPVPQKSDFEQQFTHIVSREQRLKYKEEFNRNYDRYRRLHSHLDGISKHFTQLEERLKREQTGSESWERVKNEILKEYQEIKQDKSFMKTQKEFQYLHRKLDHIKKLVHEYDVTHQ